MKKEKTPLKRNHNPTDSNVKSIRKKHIFLSAHLKEEGISNINHRTKTRRKPRSDARFDIDMIG